jgi:glutathione peroxidase
MKYFLSIAIIACLSAFTLITGNPSIHSFKVKSINGGTIDFSKFKGKKILVVNTASKWWLYSTIRSLTESSRANTKTNWLLWAFLLITSESQEPGSDGEDC